MTRDARRGDAWSLAQRLKNGLVYGLVRAALALADRIPEPLLCATGRRLGGVAWWLFPRARRIAVGNVARTLAGVDAVAVARASFVTAGENLALTLLLRRPAARVLERVVIGEDTRALLEASLSRGSAVFVSAHFGPFELIAPCVAALGIPASIVVRQSYDARLDAVVDQHRRAHGVVVIHRGGTRGAAAMRRALRGRTLLGLLADLPGRGTRRTGTLFGCPDRLAAGPAVLGARMDVPVLVGVLKPRTNGTYELVVDSVKAKVAPDAIRRAFERAVRGSPEQWLWMGDPLGLQSQS